VLEREVRVVRRVEVDGLHGAWMEVWDERRLPLVELDGGRRLLWRRWGIVGGKVMRPWWAYETMILLFVSMLCCFSDCGPARLRHQFEGVSTTFPAPFQSTSRATSCRHECRPAPLECWIPKSQLPSALRITLLIIPSSDKLRRLHLSIPILAVVEVVESKSCEGREESRVSRFVP